MVFNNFVSYCLKHGASVTPLTFNSSLTDNMGICNPSIFIDTDGSVKLIIRNVNYMLWNSEQGDVFSDTYGPLCYITPDNYTKLATRNFLFDAMKDEIKEIKMKSYNHTPIWDFVGCEDMRLFRWENKLYGCGVRRDTTIDGTGRMELCEIDSDSAEEVSRVRIEPPEASYCEKNWMPILDMPYHFVKWCNPLQIVKIDPSSVYDPISEGRYSKDTPNIEWPYTKSEIVTEKEYPQDIDNLNIDNSDIRGSSQVITVGDYRMALIHRCTLWMNAKKQKRTGIYTHQFIVWDKDWNIVRISEPFNFSEFGIEFSNGLAYNETSKVFYIPFSLQDNCAFVLTADEKTMIDFIFGNYNTEYTHNFFSHMILQFLNNPSVSENCMEMGKWYEESGQYAAAMVMYRRAAELDTFNSKKDKYEAMYKTGRCLELAGGRGSHLANIWCRMIDELPERPEGYYKISELHYSRNEFPEAYIWSKKAVERLNNAELIDPLSIEMQYIQSKYGTDFYKDCINDIKRIKKKYVNIVTPEIYSAIENFEKRYYRNKENEKRIL